MIINNKSIKGIYRYNSNVEFEPGDFVLDSEVLYKVLQTTKGNIPRTSPDYFEVYVGNNCTSLEEYKKGAMKKDCVLYLWTVFFLLTCPVIMNKDSSVTE